MAAGAGQPIQPGNHGRPGHGRLVCGFERGDNQSAICANAGLFSVMRPSNHSAIAAEGTCLPCHLLISRSASPRIIWSSAPGISSPMPAIIASGSTATTTGRPSRPKTISIDNHYVVDFIALKDLTLADHRRA